MPFYDSDSNPLPDNNDPGSPLSPTSSETCFDHLPGDTMSVKSDSKVGHATHSHDPRVADPFTKHPFSIFANNRGPIMSNMQLTPDQAAEIFVRGIKSLPDDILRDAVMEKYACVERSRYQLIQATWDLEGTKRRVRTLQRVQDYLERSHVLTEAEYHYWLNMYSNRGLSELRDEELYYGKTLEEQTQAHAMDDRELGLAEDEVEVREIGSYSEDMADGEHITQSIFSLRSLIIAPQHDFVDMYSMHIYKCCLIHYRDIWSIGVNFPCLAVKRISISGVLHRNTRRRRPLQNPRDISRPRIDSGVNPCLLSSESQSSFDPTIRREILSPPIHQTSFTQHNDPPHDPHDQQRQISIAPSSQMRNMYIDTRTDYDYRNREDHGGITSTSQYPHHDNPPHQSTSFSYSRPIEQAHTTHPARFPGAYTISGRIPSSLTITNPRVAPYTRPGVRLVPAYAPLRPGESVRGQSLTAGVFRAGEETMVAGRRPSTRRLPSIQQMDLPPSGPSSLPAPPALQAPTQSARGLSEAQGKDILNSAKDIMRRKILAENAFPSPEFNLQMARESLQDAIQHEIRTEPIDSTSWRQANKDRCTKTLMGVAATIRSTFKSAARLSIHASYQLRPDIRDGSQAEVIKKSLDIPPLLENNNFLHRVDNIGIVHLFEHEGVTSLLIDVIWLGGLHRYIQNSMECFIHTLALAGSAICCALMEHKDGTFKPIEFSASSFQKTYEDLIKYLTTVVLVNPDLRLGLEHLKDLVYQRGQSLIVSSV
ncbi:hypothetical protein BJ138DRAFT_1220589 [Hygrophoropsis aurantiaca]|uniref:Uncharacterized protein n=1 Tax=Hygrophoropsis aurantiaca TaxID=72124 RepID=A0ACB8ALQ9_9AGAM|nr:hypothetical protein BJ138DRAFT_1220589 [Hygrophoropsis aurantiaca]